VDTIGEAYIVGYSFTDTFPVTPSALPTACGGEDCVYFAKLDATGSNLLYSSFLGSGSNASVAIDPMGNALIGGTTRGGIPTTAGAVQSTCKPCISVNAGFFSKINPSAIGAASLVYSTYLSGSGGKFGVTPVGDAIYAVASDPNGNAIVTGQATSPDFPVTANAYQSVCSGVCASPFVSVIDPALSGASSLPYSTYLNGTGGINNQIAFADALAVDANHNIYVGGNTTGQNFPVSPNTFIPQCPNTGCGGGSAFIAELNPNASPANQLVYGTYLGGTSSIGNEAVTGLGFDSNGRIYAAGHTLSQDFPVTPDAAQPSCLACPGALQNSGNDGFLTVLNPAALGLNQLVYSTFLGGNRYDAATGLAMGPMGLVAVAGYSSSIDFPTTVNAFELQCPACGNIGVSGSNSDAFVSVFQF
jgi:hypothetical protein